MYREGEGAGESVSLWHEGGHLRPSQLSCIAAARNKILSGGPDPMELGSCCGGGGVFGGPANARAYAGDLAIEELEGWVGVRARPRQKNNDRVELLRQFLNLASRLSQIPFQSLHSLSAKVLSLRYYKILKRIRFPLPIRK